MQEYKKKEPFLVVQKSTIANAKAEQEEVLSSNTSK